MSNEVSKEVSKEESRVDVRPEAKSEGKSEAKKEKHEENRFVAGAKGFLAGIANFFRESRAELRKVQWPNRKETSTYTAIVIIVSLGIAGFIWVVDQGLSYVLKFLIA